MTISLSNEDYERLRNIAKAMGIISASSHHHNFNDHHWHNTGYNGPIIECHRNDGWFVDMMERMHQRIFEEASGEAKGG